MAERKNWSYKQPEPATFAYLRQAGAELGSEISDKLDQVLAGITLDQVGPDLVDKLGGTTSRTLVARVRDVAEHQLLKTKLENKPDDRVAKSALRWAGRAERRIVDERWVEAFPTHSRSHEDWDLSRQSNSSW